MSETHAGSSNRIRILTWQTQCPGAAARVSKPDSAHSSPKTSCIASESFPSIDNVGKSVGCPSLTLPGRDMNVMYRGKPHKYLHDKWVTGLVVDRVSKDENRYGRNKLQRLSDALMRLRPHWIGPPLTIWAKTSLGRQR